MNKRDTTDLYFSEVECSKTNILRTTHDSDHTGPRSNYALSLWIDYSCTCSSVQYVCKFFLSPNTTPI